MCIGASFVDCRFTSTETVLTVRNGEPSTATSSFAQLLNTGNRRSASLPSYADSGVRALEVSGFGVNIREAVSKVDYGDLFASKARN